MVRAGHDLFPCTSVRMLAQTRPDGYILCSFTSSNNPIGSLYDSGGPNGNYANNQNCTFLIAPPCADTVKLQFSAFQLESNYDFVRIYDGEDATGILLATLTGNASLSTIYRAASGKMFIRFTSDVSIVMSGIAAHWTTVIHDNLPVASFTSSDLEIAFGQNITFTNTSSYGDEYFWDVDGDGVDDYTSPNVTHTYTTPGVHTVRLITTNCNGSDTTSMLITVQEAPVLDFVGIWTDTITSCDDSFSFSGTITNNGSGDLLWSATHPSYTITPSSGVLEPGQSTSILISAPIYNSAGTYETTLTLNTNDPDNNSVSTTMTAVQEVSCIFSMCLNSSTDSPSGTLYDSGGPTGNYANNQNCSFLIAPACADTIKFQFTSFQTQVTYDVVRIYDGENASGTLLATLSGTISLGTVYSAPSGKMFITFVTNGSTIFSGFAGNWTTITQTQAPSAAFVASNDFPDYAEAVSFTSQTSVADEYFWDIDGDGITDYTSANVTHSYTTAGTYTVQLITSNCLGSDTSSMEIVVKNPPSIQLIGTWTDTIYNCQEMISFSGTIINNGPSDLTWSTSHPSFSIVPSSGVLGEGQSVNIVITGLAYGAAGTYNSLLTVTSNDPLNGIIETNLSVVQLLTCNLLMCVNGSSNLPIGTLYDSGGPSGNYSDNQNCTFLIAPPCADTVKLHFSAFQLENNFDFVRIYDGEDATGILLATLTGNASLSPIYSAASGKMFIRFTSDVSVVMSGFTAHWKTIELFAPPQADFDYTGDLLTNSAIDFSLVTFSDNLTYDWSFGDGTSSTDPNPSHIYLEEGTYVVTLIVTDECGRTDEVSMNLIIDVNSLIHVLEAGLQIYPNPSRTGLFTLKGFSESVSAIEITDQTGRIVPYTLNPMDNSVYQIDISHEAPGVYYLKYGNRVYKLIK